MKVSFVIGLLGCFFAAAAQAFTLQGTNSNIKGWKANELEFHLNPTNCPPEVDSLLDDAMNVWNGVPTSSLTVKRGDDTGVTLAEAFSGTAGDVPAIFCSTNMAAEAQLDANVIPGVAMGMRTSDSGHVSYGFIIINAQEGAQSNVSYLDHDLVEVVLAHEIGHVLGLGHSEATEALMYYDASKKKKLGLAQDDMDGLTYLYPRDELQGDNLFGGCGVIGGASAMNILIALALMLCPLVFVVRREIL